MKKIFDDQSKHNNKSNYTYMREVDSILHLILCLLPHAHTKYCQIVGFKDSPAFK